MKDKEEIIKLRDIYLDLAELCDELINISDRAEKGEDVEKELNEAIGSIVLKTMFIQQMS